MILLEAGDLSWYQSETFFGAIRIGALVLFALPLLYLLGKWVKSAVAKRFKEQQGMVAGKLVFYGGLAVVATMILHQLGFQLTALLGAIGIAGVAVGFASQTSVSNIIGGLFLIIDNPFSIGDAIKVGDVTGEVLAIDLLSVKIRSFDNKLVRIPNESLVKATVTNFSRFPIRRVDLDLSVSYKSDLAKVKSVLAEIAETNPLCLAEPAPTILFTKLGETSVDIFFGVWVQKSDYGAVKNALVVEMRDRFFAEGIDTPTPELTLYPGISIDPVTVQVKEQALSKTGRPRKQKKN